MKKLLIYGGGPIAEVAEYYFRVDSDYEVAAFTNSLDYISKESPRDKPIIAFEDVEKHYPPDRYEMFVAVGYAKTNRVRQMRFEEAKQKGYRCASYISSRSVCHGNLIGENCFVLENNVIQPFVTIGDNVFLWSGNHIGHHSEIEDNCFISSHVVVSGCCRIGENSFLGVNSTLKDNVKLGRFTVVSSGAVVMKDCPERTLVKALESEYRIINRDII